MSKTYDRLRRLTRRIYPRAPLELRVHYRTTGSFLVSYTVNLSRGGLFVETDDPLPEGSRVTLRLEVPGAEREVETTALVVWVRRETNEIGEPPGMGMRFERADEDWGDLVDQMVSSFAGLTIAVVAASAARRGTIARLVRGVMSSRVLELEPATAAGSSAGVQLDLAVVDVDGSDVARRVVHALRGDGTPVLALAASSAGRDIARSDGAIEALEASPSMGDLRGAVLRALGRPQVEKG